LRRNGGDLSAIFGAGPDDVESLVRDTYRSLVREPGGWVSLADLRDKLAGVPAAAVDAALKQLVRQPDVILIPETDQSSLNARDREAAVRIGGEVKHLLAIEGRWAGDPLEALGSVTFDWAPTPDDVWQHAADHVDGVHGNGARTVLSRIA